MRKQKNPLQVRLVVLESGERLPLLVECATGEPLYEPALYVLTQLRAKNLASATITQHCWAMMVLCFFLKSREIDLDDRMSRGQLLTLAEVNALARCCRLMVEELIEELVDLDGKSKALRVSKVTSLDLVRMRKKPQAIVKEVGSETAAVRGHYIVAYLKWLVGLRTADNVVTPHPDLSIASSTALRALAEHLPAKRRDAQVARKGFTKRVRQRLLEVVDPDSNDNPWAGGHCRCRNELIVRWLLHLGVRRGELLGIQTSDIDFQRNEVTIARRADDINDPRRDEPNTKTYDRLLPLSGEMAALARNYILKIRNQFKGARRHKYLLVANGSGAPLSKAAFSKIFVELQNKFPDLSGVHPHLFRHTWNDDFSEQMDHERIPEEREQKIRSLLMGWAPTSGTAATYTRRHVERKANEASLKMQSRSAKVESK